LSYLANTQADRQTDKQTKSGKNITSLAQVKMDKSTDKHTDEATNNNK